MRRTATEPTDTDRMIDRAEALCRRLWGISLDDANFRNACWMHANGNFGQTPRPGTFRRVVRRGIMDDPALYAYYLKLADVGGLVP